MKIRTFTTTAVAVLAISAPAAQAVALDPTSAQVTPAGYAVEQSGAGAPQSVTQPAPFSWGDAALGAGGAALIITLLVGSVRLSSLTRDAHQSLRTS